MTIAARIRDFNREQDINLKAQDFCQVAKWILLGNGNSRNTLSAAQNGKTSTRVLEAVKAAVLPGTTSDGSFAAALSYQELADGFLASLRNLGVFDGMLPFSKHVPLNTQIAVVTLGATAASIGEGQSKIISKLSLAASAFSPRKAVAIIVASSELLNFGNSSAQLFQQELSRAVAAETDAKFLSVITTGISTTGSAGSNWQGISSDMAALIGGLSLGANSRVFIAMNPSDVKHMAVQIASNGERAFPTVSINGGDYAGAIIIPTDALSGQIVAFDAAQIAANSSGIELDSSTQAAIQLNDAPDSPPTASTNISGLWQMNLTGLRATRYFGCERLRTNAVSVITSVSYGSANSPA